MRKNWMVKAIVPVIALTLMGACSTADNNDDENPVDTNTPENEEQMDNDTNDGDNVPEEDVNYDKDKDAPEYQKQDQDPDMNSDNGRRGA